MALPAPVANLNDIVETRLLSFFTDQLGENVLHYRVISVTAVGVTLLDFAQALDVAINGNYKAMLANAANYVGVQVRRISPTKSTSFLTRANGGAGTAGAIAQARQVAGMVTKESGIPGPGGRGRMYIPFPSTTDTDLLGAPTAGYMVNLGILVAQLQVPLVVVVGASSVAFQPIILKRSNVLLSNFWVASDARQAWATHRSRGSYGRQNPAP